MLADLCEKSGFILRISVKLVKFLHVVIPVLLIILISYDLFKAFTSQLDDKAKRDVTNKAIKRFIYAAIVFLIPTIITFVFTSINKLISKDGEKVNATSVSWLDCWLSEYTGVKTRRYGGTQYDPKATYTPSPTVVPRSTNTPVPTATPCSYYVTSSTCANAGCHWNNNTCSSVVPPTVYNYLCCYRDQNSGLYNYTYTTNASVCTAQLHGMEGESEESCCALNGPNGCNASQPTATPPPVQVYSCCWYENALPKYSENVEYNSCRSKNGDANFTIEECCYGFYSNIEDCRATFPY